MSLRLFKVQTRTTLWVCRLVACRAALVSAPAGSADSPGRPLVGLFGWIGGTGLRPAHSVGALGAPLVRLPAAPSCEVSGKAYCGYANECGHSPGRGVLGSYPVGSYLR